MSSTPPGWYPDGSPQNTTRYWDGSGWTQSVRFDPIPNRRLSSVAPSIALGWAGIVLGGVMSFFGVISIGVAVVVLVLMGNLFGPPEGAVETTGTVVATSIDSEGYCSPIVSFTEGAREYEVTMSVRAKPCLWRVGQPVPTFYVPGDAEFTAMIVLDDGGLNDMVGSTFLAIGIGTLVVGLIVLFFGLRARVRAGRIA